jgi:hypothetical protein
MFTLMGNNSENNGAGGCLAALGNLLILGLVLMVLYAWATHQNPLIRISFWIFMGIIVYYGWIEPSFDPEPRYGTIEWYEWKAKHMH